MRSLTLPLDEYHADLAKRETIGRKEGLRRCYAVLDAIAEDDMPEAVAILVEDFEGDASGLKRALAAFRLTDIAEAIWSGKRAAAP